MQGFCGVIIKLEALLMLKMVLQYEFWHKNGKFSKGHDFWPWTIQILFVEIYIVIPFLTLEELLV